MKTIKLLMALFIIISLYGCGSNKEDDLTVKDNTSTDVTQPDESDNTTSTKDKETKTTEDEEKKGTSSTTDTKKNPSTSSGSTSSSTTTKKDDNKKNPSSSGSSSSGSSSGSTSTTKPSTGTGSSSGNTTTTPPKEETPKPTPPPTPTWAMSESQMIAYSKSIVNGLGFDWDEPSTKDNSGWFAPKTISITMNEDKIKEIIKMSINATCRKLDPKQGGVKGYFEKKDDNTFMFYTLY